MVMVFSRLRWCGLAAAPILLASCAADIGDTDASTQSVVGGHAETGYAPVGYLVHGQSPTSMKGPICGATLVAPSVVVTASHCINAYPTDGFGVGFGTAGAGPKYVAKKVFMHPLYDPNALERWHNDIAVLIFPQPISQPTAHMSRAASGDQTRYIGYGRTTPGGPDVHTGYTFERKSAREKMTATDALGIYTTGIDGGLCWGDSGGPLFRDGTNDVLGVLADFNAVFDCHVGNDMIFTSLDAQQAFIAAAVTCQDRDDACVRDQLNGHGATER
jgi:secreted trypsin-like serine protease